MFEQYKISIPLSGYVLESLRLNPREVEQHVGPFPYTGIPWQKLVGQHGATIETRYPKEYPQPKNPAVHVVQAQLEFEKRTLT